MTWGRTYLWIAILIFAAAASVVARLVEIGEANLIDGRNPISFCNLLFAGNLVAALTLLALYHRDVVRYGLDDEMLKMCAALKHG